jgi:hypothetical protein
LVRSSRTDAGFKMVQTSDKQSRQTNFTDESSRLELEKQRRRDAHKKALHKYFKPTTMKFKKT